MAHSVDRLNCEPPIQVRPVWAHNLESEFALIREAVEGLTYAAMDTEFPGVIHRPCQHPRLLSAVDRYALLKSNVDALHIIQFGLTLSDPSGSARFVWEFNFRDFDLRRGLHAPDSIALLESHGIDFNSNREKGIDSHKFAELLISSGLVCDMDGSLNLNWVTFHSAYDFGYLIKILTCRELPQSMNEFLGLVRIYFGERIFDVKEMMRFCNGVYGGLDQLARILKVEREVGKCHQAGSDSLLTMQTFSKMKELYFTDGKEKRHAGVIFGLEVC